MNARPLRLLPLALLLVLPATAEITLPEPPPGHEAEVKTKILEDRAFIEHQTKRPLGEIRVDPGVPFFSVGPVLREDREFVSRMTHRAWTFPVSNDGMAIGWAEMSRNTTTGEWEVDGFTLPPEPEAFSQALEAAAKHPKVLTGRFEARTAIIHAGEMIQTLWLHSSDDDLFIPYGPHFENSLWHPFEVYSEKEIIAFAQTKAMQLRGELSYAVGTLPRLLKAYREEAAKTGDIRPATLERLKATLKDELSLVMLGSAEREIPRSHIRYHPPGPDAAPDDLIATLQDKGCLAGITLDGTFRFYREEPAE